MKILALDPGQSFGWAISGAVNVNTGVNTAQYFVENYLARIGGSVALCGAWDLTPCKGFGERFNILAQLVESQKDSLSSIIYEVAPGLRGMASVWHLGYRAIVLAAADRIGVPMIEVNPSTWKRDVIGNGQASKDEIRAYAVKSYGVDPTAPQDAIDALCILARGIEAS